MVIKLILLKRFIFALSVILVMENLSYFWVECNIFINFSYTSSMCRLERAKVGGPSRASRLPRFVRREGLSAPGYEIADGTTLSSLFARAVLIPAQSLN